MASWMIDEFGIHKRAFIIDGVKVKFNPKMVESLIGFRDREVDNEDLEEDVTVDERLNSSSTWTEGVEFRSKDLPLISHWDGQRMLKLHRLIMDKLGGYHIDNVMAKLKSEMLKAPVIEIVPAHNWLLKMEEHINQQEAAIEALRAESKIIIYALEGIKKELHTLSLAMYSRQNTQGESKEGTTTVRAYTEEQATELEPIDEQNEDEQASNEKLKEEHPLSEHKTEHDSKEEQLMEGELKEDMATERESAKEQATELMMAEDKTEDEHPRDEIEEDEHPTEH
ncbi:hypothetical protein CDL15_Pgr011956 [Punica granatum]|uniref:Uncharacterized protein n=1 Tax=Punica granatum TaxID=22663 RepID=A0A218WDT3_PUNGR|nr:hypothetical protein CDL15_Pgr011956 [Punica granatum]